MTIVHDIRKTVTDTTPVYAVVGATDLAVERLREARTRAAAARQDLHVATLQDKAVKRFEKVTDRAQAIPAQVKEQGAEAAGKARETYSELAVRGEKLVKRMRNQKSTQDLLAQANSTVSLGKGAVTTVRKAAHDTQEAAKATLATGRRQAGSVAATVQGGVKATSHNLNEAAVTTLTAAEGTVTTAKKSTAAAQRATRSVSTSARKTATSAAKAAKTATPKVGD